MRSVAVYELRRRRRNVFFHFGNLRTRRMTHGKTEAESTKQIKFAAGNSRALLLLGLNAGFQILL